MLARPIKNAHVLLLPIIFEFSKQESIFIDKYQEDLVKVGLFLEPFGHQSYAIRSHPTWLPKGYEEEVIREMVDQVMQTEKVNVEEIREEAAILMAFKGTIMANYYLKEVVIMYHL